MKYALNVSHNCGTTYVIEKESDDLEELKKMGKELDKRILRWTIEDKKGQRIEACAIHKDIRGFMKRVNEPKEEKMAHGFVIDFLKKEREDIEKKLKYYIQTKNDQKRLRAQIVEINIAIFALLKDARR